MTKKMKCIFIFFSIAGVISNQPAKLEFTEGKIYNELSLPYEITGKKTKVFDENTSRAIDILKMEVDGNTITPEPDGSSGEFQYRFETRKVEKGESIFYITMLWNKWPKGKLQWTDGKILGFSYTIRPGSRILKIRYRIIVPYPFITIAFYKGYRIPEWAYTPEYEAIVDLTNISW